MINVEIHFQLDKSPFNRLLAKSLIPFCSSVLRWKRGISLQKEEEEEAIQFSDGAVVARDAIMRWTAVGA